MSAAARPSALAVGLRGLCPRCGASTLFAGALSLNGRCRACQLDFTEFNVGDGPAAFVTALAGGLVVILAIALELTAEPPLWLHVVLWLPLTLMLVVGGLRVTKGWLLASEFRRGAREGRHRSARP